MQSTTDRVRTSVYTPTPEQIARDYKPKYHVFYDPTWGAPRVENVPLGMSIREPVGDSDE